jgi:exodeoxyribonuclease VII large subunit
VSHNASNTNESMLVYSPNALLNALGNSLVSPLLNKVFTAKGVLKFGKGMNYNGFYYDLLKDEFTDSSITLVIPELLRRGLKDGQIIEVTVYLSKRHQTVNARIDLLLTVTEIISRKEKTVDEKEVKSFELIQRKIKQGFKDADAFIKSKIYSEERVNVTILIGTTAIIDNDIKHQVKDASVVFNIRYVRINLTQVNEIIRAIKENRETDMLIISRGGGENMQVFDNLVLGEEALSIDPVFITAIGHSDDDPLLQKLADKHFITPTALGQYFNAIYNSTIEEQSNSRARLISDLSKQIDLNYQSKLAELNNKLNYTTATLQSLTKSSEIQLKKMSAQLENTKATNRTLRIWLIAVVIFLIVYFFVIR